MAEKDRMRIVIVTGMSGSGKSSCLRIFEDMGYYCMDNLPPQLAYNFVDLARHSDKKIEQVAIGVDIRSGAFFESLEVGINRIKSIPGVDVSILFLDSDDPVLIRRYKEKRRPHPMDRAGNIFDGIQRERVILRDLRLSSDHIIDTSHLSLGQLKQLVEQIYCPDEKPELTIFVNSFGYKYGILLDADIVMDARFLPNPFYVDELKALTGLDQAVQDYVNRFPQTQEFIDRMDSFLDFLIPYFIQEGKTQLVIGIGCTGGQHRSVVMAEEVGRRLSKKNDRVIIKHRDREHWTKGQAGR